MADVAEMRDIVSVSRHASWTKAGPVVSHLPEETIDSLGERAAATIGEASPLGLWGFATGTWIAATIVGGLLPDGDLVAVAPILILFGGIAQFIAGLYSYRRVNALMANAFCCFGAFNTVIGVIALLQATHVLPTAQSTNLIVGFFFESFGFIAAALMLGALRTNMVTVGVLATLAVGYVLGGIPSLNGTIASGSSVIGTIGMCFLFISSLLAYYAGAALLVNSTWKRHVLPVFGEP
jgi:succinate-acetate transporter protein